MCLSLSLTVALLVLALSRITCVVGVKTDTHVVPESGGSVQGVGASDGASPIVFEACSRWHSDAGVRGLMLPGESAAVELERCGLQPGSSWGLLLPLKDLLLLSIGVMDVGRFAADGMRAPYLRLFAEAAAVSLGRHCSARRGPRRNVASVCGYCSADNRQDMEEVLFEEAVVTALAAASFYSPESGVDGPDFVALASVTVWLRRREQLIEKKGQAMEACIMAGGKHHGYACQAFIYGSTYFHSWLQVMRFPAVARALELAVEAPAEAASAPPSLEPPAETRHEVSVLGSSLGWQTLWAALTFGIRSVGYELLKHRVHAANLAVAQLDDFDVSSRLVEFQQADAVASDLSNSVVVYLTDLTWPKPACANVSAHVRSQLLEAGGLGTSAVVVSNQRLVWRDDFTNIGSLQVRVTWKDQQEFQFWTVKPP